MLCRAATMAKGEADRFVKMPNPMPLDLWREHLARHRRGEDTIGLSFL